MTITYEENAVDGLERLGLKVALARLDQVAQQAAAEAWSYSHFLGYLLAGELAERHRKTVELNLQFARFPYQKLLAEFDYAAQPSIDRRLVEELATGRYLYEGRNVIFLGPPGVGKTHLASGLCIAACQQKKRCRFVTAAGLVNELVEAQHHNLLGRALQRWSRYDLIVLDEVGYVPFAQVGAELLFQVISERAERATLIITTNLPFSEWTQVFPSARLCKALLDRVTDRAHIIETGSESYRFRRTVETKKKRQSH